MENKLEPWDKDLMDKLLDEFEKTQPLDEYPWEQVIDIKWALWIGYNHVH